MLNTFPKMTDLDWIRYDIADKIRVRQFEIDKSHDRESAYGESDYEKQSRKLLQAEIDGLEVAMTITAKQLKD